MIKNCLICSSEFRTWPYSVKSGRGIYCSLQCLGAARRGKPNGRKGEPNFKMRGANNPMANEEIRKKHRQNLIRGKEHYFWKGGVTPIYKTIRKSPEYIAWRLSVFERDNYTCIECGARPGNGKRVDLQADHIKPFALYPELRFDLDNGRSLCIPCHKLTDTYGGKILKLTREGAIV